MKRVTLTFDNGPTAGVTPGVLDLLARMGFIEETGAAQHYRDARIAQIYEGTNGIQAVDLVARKLPLSGGHAVQAFVDELRGTAASVAASNDPAFGATAAKLAEAIEALDRASAWLLGALEREPDAAPRARRHTCGCSAPRPAAPRSPKRRSPASASLAAMAAVAALAPTPPAAPHWPASSPRISACRRTAWNAR